MKNIILESEEVFRQLFEEHMAVMLLIDPESRKIIDGNPAAVRFYGYERQQLRTMHITDINMLGTTKTNHAMNQAVSKERNRFIFNHRLANGETRTVEVYSSPVNISGSKILFSVIHDITDRIKAEEALQASEIRYRSLFDSMEEGFAHCEMIYDARGKAVDFRYLNVNPAFAVLTGLPVEKVIGRTVKEVIPGIEQSWIRAYDEVVKSGISRRIDNPVAELGIDFEVHAWRSGPARFAVVFSNVTERKKLESEIRRLYKKEKLQRQKLQADVKVRNLFIDILAHELRNPLSAIISSSGALRDISGSADNVRARLAANINLSGQVLAKRLDELLDAAKYSKGTFKLQKQPLDMKKFLEEAVERFLPVIHSKFQILKIAISDTIPEIEADPSRIEQVIINLLSNASKYSPEQSTISITARTHYKKLLIQIEDHGEGISQEDQQTLFQPYQRVSRKGQTSGKGLGLYVSRIIVEAHDGKIRVQSQPGKGSIFSFSLPTTKTKNKK